MLAVLIISGIFIIDILSIQLTITTLFIFAIVLIILGGVKMMLEQKVNRPATKIFEFKNDVLKGNMSIDFPIGISIFLMTIGVTTVILLGWYSATQHNAETILMYYNDETVDINLKFAVVIISFLLTEMFRKKAFKDPKPLEHSDVSTL
jgi:HAMP domain-containing protein